MIKHVSLLTLLTAAVLIAAAPSSGASAQTPLPHPCAQQRAAAMAACQADPCTASCKSARAVVKQCRIDNNIAKNPSPQHKGGGRKCPSAGSVTPMEPEVPVAPNQ